jgi:hypothetical protein
MSAKYKNNEINIDPKTINSESEDNSGSEDIDKEIEEMESKAEEKAVNDLFKQYLEKYIKYDNLIKEKNQEIKELKQKKKPCEDNIISFLEKHNRTHIDLEKTGSRIVKNTKIIKEPIKEILIKESINMGMKKENIVIDDKKCEEVISSIMELLDSKRKTKTRTSLSRKSNLKK